MNIGENHPLRRPQDDLFAERREVIAIAKRKLFQYKTGKLDDNDIISMALLCGFWSIWVYIFKDQSALLDKLIAEFKGTYPECRTKNIDRL